MAAPPIAPENPSIKQAFEEHMQENGHSKRVKDMNDWLPVTGDRHAKWWYSTFHNVTAMVGAGVLGLPNAMVYFTWGPGVVVLILSWSITLFTLWQMVEMHEMVEGKRFDRYHELGQEAFGQKLGLWIVVPQQLIVEVGGDIVYMVTGGLSLKRFYDLVCKGNCPIRNSTSAWIAIFSSVHFLLAQLPNFNSIAGISLAAAVMSLSYSTIAWCIPAALGHSSPPLPTAGRPNYHLLDQSLAAHLFGTFNALGTVAFAYAGHSVVLEIQATIPSTKECPSKIPMWRGVVFAYIIVALCYFPVAIVGYWAYGNNVTDNVIIYVNRPVWLVAAANLMVVVHVIGSYQIFAMPVFDMLESVWVKRFRLAPSRKMRLITRSSYVAATAFIAMTFPFFGALLGFFGGFAFAPTTYFLPCIIWLRIVKPKKWSFSWFLNWFIIFLGVMLMLVSSMGGLRTIIVKSSTFKFYQ